MRHTLSYLAGLFDGEGCIYIAKSSPGKSHTIRPYRFQGYATVVIREKVVCDYLQKTFGGKVVLSKRNNPKHSDVYKWTCNGKALDYFLKEITPFLILKRKQALIAAKFQEVKHKVGNRSISNKHYKQSASYYDIMKQLNRKGPK